MSDIVQMWPERDDFWKANIRKALALFEVALQIAIFAFDLYNTQNSHAYRNAATVL